MIEPTEVERLILAAFPGAEVVLEDLTGTRDHYRMLVVAEAFHGKSSLERHRLVYQVLAEPLRGPLHALSLETHTPESRAQLGKS